ncbi:MAG: inovirus-type Gp2 protein [Lentisphaeria bacterium]|nr:inovirus-type Gp2 protein [Lentisphaeria bacterium]
MQHDISSFYTLNMPMNEKILNALNKIMTNYIDNHSKTWVQRIDVTPPKGMAQEVISDFNHRFIECEKKQGFDPAYVMAREIKKDGTIHYHMALFLNGQKTESTYTHFENAKRILNNVASGGQINYCNDGHPNGIMIRRNDPDLTNLHAVQQQISYLAKTEQKENVKGKTFFTSQIKKKS